ncbi:hypothetical protein J3Q64DRAFT_1847520 [Phycomyces blakesleeanus]|uniref:Major facilitator superfamily (MFS) profile domain-containing protein n=1 Tax=Phycomyces blakesleeanus TaxID=4837 RepID=A0ABR3B3J7_PHYBL
MPDGEDFSTRKVNPSVEKLILSQVLYCLPLAIFFDGRSLQGAAQNLSYLTTSRFITDMAITETLALGLFLLPRRLGEESIQSQSSSEHAILYAQQQSPVQFTGLNYPTARKNTTKEKITSHPYITSQYMTSYHDISHMCFGETGEEKASMRRNTFLDGFPPDATKIMGGPNIMVPLYQSEIAPPEIRGSLVSLQQLAVTFGILISFWIDYGTANLSTEAQWRIPLCLQLAIGLVLGVGILFFPHSPRWLMSVGKEEQALQVLSKLRRLPDHHPKVIKEWREIKINVTFDKLVEIETYPDYVDAGTSGRFKIFMMGYVELFRKGMRNRLFIACAIQFFQQFVGINALIYYAPKIFQSVGLTGSSVSLLATGVVGVINFLMTIPTVLFLDMVGRKKMLMIASVGLSVSMIIVAIITGLYEDDWPNHTAEGWVAVVFVYIFIANFAYSWGPIGWVIPSEIFPLRARAKAMSISTSANWMCNFIMGMITPPMLAGIHYGTYVFLAVFCVLSFLFTWFFIPETKGLSLEEMDNIFGGDMANSDSNLMSRVREEVHQQGVPAKPMNTANDSQKT